MSESDPDWKPCSPYDPILTSLYSNRGLGLEVSNWQKITILIMDNSCTCQNTEARRRYHQSQNGAVWATRFGSGRSDHQKLHKHNGHAAFLLPCLVRGHRGVAGRAEGAVRDVAGQASGVHRCPAPKASPVLQSEEGGRQSHSH